MANFHVQIMDWARAEPLAAPIRFAAFFDDSRPGIELDEQDAAAVHAVAYDEAGQAIATGRLLPDGRIGPFAAAKDWHRLGVDAVLLDALLAEARKRGLAMVTVTAPLQVAELYREQGFAADGKIFQEAGILQQPMRKTL
ncbi:MAG TPA: GNAT family N-acetyltransferase [Burkholderiales bacterium]|nr:GNAT family N-acetyltransferase [Burkholderiales bacterium]